ncbi:MAG TPA: hypothetical protein VF194_08050 [Ferrovibrio sp.]|uniref:hypothetical protein n=1 Tax=Ferrovibrio sp. TaxID=1917215 RepID=UPI002ED1ACD3
MDEYTTAALNGTLLSQSWGPGSTGGLFYLQNNLPVPLYMYGVTTAGEQILSRELGTTVTDQKPPLLFPANTATLFNMVTDAFYILRTAFSGAFVCLLYTTSDGASDASDAETILVDATNLLPPNQIGLFPGATTDTPIPPDSPRVLVGVGATLTSPANLILREQFWQRMGDSYSLAPGTKRTVSTTLVSGMQNTSSHEESVSKSLGLSSAFGWGPVSASLSANLSANSSSFQQISISTETTQYESLELSNTTSDTLYFLRWQLTDVITVYQTYTATDSSPTEALSPAAPNFPNPANGPGGMNPLTTVSIAQSPVLISDGYNPAALPAPPSAPAAPTESINMNIIATGSGDAVSRGPVGRRVYKLGQASGTARVTGGAKSGRAAPRTAAPRKGARQPGKGTAKRRR